LFVNSFAPELTAMFMGSVSVNDSNSNAGELENKTSITVNFNLLFMQWVGLYFVMLRLFVIAHIYQV